MENHDEMLARLQWTDRVIDWIDSNLKTKNVDVYQYNKLREIQKQFMDHRVQILQRKYDTDLFDFMMQERLQQNPDLFQGEAPYSGVPRAYKEGETASIRNFIPNYSFGDPMRIPAPPEGFKKKLSGKI